MNSLYISINLDFFLHYIQTRHTQGHYFISTAPYKHLLPKSARQISKELKHVTEVRVLFIRQIVKRICMSNLLINQLPGTWCMLNGQQRGGSMALG